MRLVALRQRRRRGCPALGYPLGQHQRAQGASRSLAADLVPLSRRMGEVSEPAQQGDGLAQPFQKGAPPVLRQAQDEGGADAYSPSPTRFLGIATARPVPSDLSVRAFPRQMQSFDSNGN